MKVTENENKEIVKKIREGLEKTGGYCPCRIQRTPDSRPGFRGLLPLPAVLQEQVKPLWTISR